jgi:hypothetical protein
MFTSKVDDWTAETERLAKDCEEVYGCGYRILPGSDDNLATLSNLMITWQYLHDNLTLLIKREVNLVRHNPGFRVYLVKHAESEFVWKATLLNRRDAIGSSHARTYETGGLPPGAAPILQ